MVDQMVDQNATYLTKRLGLHYYYTRRIPKELQRRLGRKRIVVSLKTKSRRKANACKNQQDQWNPEHGIGYWLICQICQEGLQVVLLGP